jgi:hypothetical protein
MYQQVKSILVGIEQSCVKRIEDNSFIPFDNGNTDYQKYLQWLSEGNIPTPPDEVTE